MNAKAEKTGFEPNQYRNFGFRKIVRHPGFQDPGFECPNRKFMKKS
jgi:hypothetical protein